MNSIIALVYLSVAVILIVFGVKQIKNRKNLRKINQKQEDEVKEKIKLGILSADTVYRERTETGRVFYEVPEDLKKAVVLNLICFAIMLILIFLGIKIGILLWGFVLAGFDKQFPVPQKFDVPTRYLNSQTAAEMFRFPLDMARRKVEPNYLNNQILVSYFESDWHNVIR